MSTLIKPILDILILLNNTRFLLGIFITTTVTKLLPEAIFPEITVLRHNYQNIITILFIVTLGMLLTNCIYLIVDFLNKKHINYMDRKATIMNLYSLSADEKLIIEECHHDNKTTVIRMLSDPALTSLCEKNIYYMASSGHPLGWAFIMYDYVWDEVKKNHNNILGH